MLAKNHQSSSLKLSSPVIKPDYFFCKIYYGLIIVLLFDNKNSDNYEKNILFTDHGLASLCFM